MFAILVTTAVFQPDQRGQRGNVADVSTTLVGNFASAKLAEAVLPAIWIDKPQCERRGVVIRLA